jgi:hypothetical protein
MFTQFDHMFSSLDSEEEEEENNGKKRRTCFHVFPYTVVFPLAFKSQERDTVG